MNSCFNWPWHLKIDIGLHYNNLMRHYNKVQTEIWEKCTLDLILIVSQTWRGSKDVHEDSMVEHISLFSTIEISTLRALSNDITHGCFCCIYVLLFSLNTIHTISFDELLNSGSMKFSFANFTQYYLFPFSLPPPPACDPYM